MIGNSWDSVLDVDRLVLALKWVNSQRQFSTIYPSQDKIVEAFKLTNFPDVKVVILGQDPYHSCDNDGVPHAHGLSFSSKSKIQTPPSLQSICKEIYSSYGKYRDNSDLTSLALQGVLLLNIVLSVEAGMANSHQHKIWEWITLGAVKSLSLRKQPTVFMLWGNSAKVASGFIDKNSYNLVLEAAHPSPLSASRGFYGCNHFKLANDFLLKHNLTGIEWDK